MAKLLLLASSIFIFFYFQLKRQLIEAPCSQKALIQYIYKNLRYPTHARHLELEGMTITQFTIDKDGSVQDLDVIIGLCQDFKDECERVLGNMPPWEPGIQRGRKVKVLYTMPIKFRLD